MKKILSLLLAVVLVATLSVTTTGVVVSADEATQIVVSSAKAAPGEKVDVNVAVKDNPGIVSLKVKVAYDAGLTLDKVTFAEMYDDRLATEVTEVTEDASNPMVSAFKADNQVTLNYFNGNKDITGDFTLATLTFAVDAKAALGDKAVAVTFDPEDIHNIAEETVKSTGVDGKITVEDPAYTITYALGGGTNNANNPKTYKYTSNAITFKNPTKKGYTFAGWYKGTKKVTGIAKGSKGNITLTAKWTANKYTIAFVGNGSTSGSTKSITTTYDKAVTLTANGFKRTGYTFKGWNTKKDGKGKAYKNKASVKNLTATANGKVTLYAQWTKVTYKINYKLNSGKNNAKNPKTYTVTSAISLKNPTRKGYNFKGWFNNAKFKGKKITKIAKGSTGNKTFYAKWAKKK